MEINNFKNSQVYNNIFSLTDFYCIENFGLFEMTSLNKCPNQEKINSEQYIRVLFEHNLQEKEIVIRKDIVKKVYSFLKINYKDRCMGILANNNKSFDPLEILNKINSIRKMRGFIGSKLNILIFPLKNFYLQEKFEPNNGFDKTFCLVENNNNFNPQQNMYNNNSETHFVLEVFKQNPIYKKENNIVKNNINNNNNFSINNNNSNNNYNQNNNKTNNYNNNTNNNYNQSNNNTNNYNNNPNNNYNLNNNNNNFNYSNNNNFGNGNNNNYNNQNNNMNISNQNNNFYNNNNTNNNFNNNNLLNNQGVQNQNYNNNMINYQINSNNYPNNNNANQNNINNINNNNQIISYNQNQSNNYSNNMNLMSNQSFNINNGNNFYQNPNFNNNMQIMNRNTNNGNNTPQSFSMNNIMNNMNNIQISNNSTFNNNMFNNNNIFINNININSNLNNPTFNSQSSCNNQNNYNQNNQNNNLNEFKLIIEGKNYLSNSFPFVGLKNVGLTCYMNSALQCLLHIPELNVFFLNIYPKQKENFLKINPSSETKGKLSEKYSLLVSKVFEKSTIKYESSSNSIRPDDFHRTIGVLNNQFRAIDANDSKDLLIFLFQSMHDELNYFGDKKLGVVPRCDQRNAQDAFDFFMKVNSELHLSIFSYLFYGIFKSETKCAICRNSYYNFQYFQILSFPLYDYDSSKTKCFNVYQGFKDYVKKVIMRGDNQCFCQYCQKLRDSEVSSKIFYTPPYLIINLDYGKNKKYNPAKINFGEYLDLTGFTESSCQNRYYELIAVSSHIGSSGVSGHYIAYCKNQCKEDENWYEFNDSRVSRSKFQNTNDFSPYVLIYKRVDKFKNL